MSYVNRLKEEMVRARQRIDFDLKGASALEAKPVDVATATEIDDRRRFLRESAGQAPLANRLLERILEGNELQPINYLARGVQASKAVARIAMRDPVEGMEGWGTGFLIAPGVMITNNHVLRNRESASASRAQFNYQVDAGGAPQEPEVFDFDPDGLFFTHAQLDFTVVAVRGGADLAGYGYLPLLGTTGKVLEGEWLTIIQHPGGQRKQIAVRENRLIKKSADVIWYTTDTTGGSSGSPVFSNDWFVVALHHMGVPVMRDGRIQTLDGTDWDGIDETRVKWEANEGIRVSRIVETLQQALPDHPLLAPMYEATPETARMVLAAESAPISRPAVSSTSSANSVPPMNRSVSFTLPLKINAEIRSDDTIAIINAQYAGAAGAGVAESSLTLEKTSPKKKPATAAFDAPFDANYETREGFVRTFLGAGFTVNLPTLSAALEEAAAELIGKPGQHELKYHNFSVVMHAARRFAIYSAANISFGNRFEMSRPQDVWREDPRIKKEAQITNFYYRKNLFDRGHLTRREDLEFGKTAKAALASAADTCHWSNCVPQHERFNQGKELWQGLERHVLETSIIEGHVNANVVTGPLLDEDDPVFADFPKIQYPVRFWKVITALDGAGKPFATAFVMDQSETIKKFGLKEADVPISPYKTYQVSIKEVERLTQLTFTYDDAGVSKSLSVYDPLAKGVPEKLKKQRARTTGFSESTLAASDAPAGYLPLDQLESVYIG